VHALIASLRAQRPVVAVVAGSGQVTHTAVAAKADLLLALNAGLYRTLGYGSLASFLPYGNANGQTEQVLRQHVLPRAGGTPVVAGVFGADPTLDLSDHIRLLRELGVRGVTNWPSLGFVDGAFREVLEAEGFDAASELRALAEARRQGLAAFGFAHTEDDAARFAPACDGLILNVGLTHRVDDRQDRRDQVQAVIARLNRMLAAVERTGHRPLCLMFGGPVTSAEDFLAVARQTSVDGLAGGSVFDRLPVQRAVEAAVRQFKAVPLGASAEPQESRLGGLLGRSPAMRQLFDAMRKVAPFDVNVCIEGPTGSGKELVATELHRLSPRAHEPFVTLNCGAIPEGLLESELFGHEKGSFTGADRRRLGKFELAHGGTLFLDEVADLSPRAQVALLRAIQQGEVVRVGGDRPVRLSVRILTATHQRLPRCVADGRFRADLYFRLNQVSLRVPSLAERREDIPTLIAEVLARLRVKLGREVAGLSREFERRLLAYSWPGNVRELEHVIGRAAILEDGPTLDGTSFQPESVEAVHEDGFRAALPGRPDPITQRRLAEEAVRRAGGNKSRAAALLGVSRKTLYCWLGLG
jgi:DNA-binding NtrC family response regulator/predicted TIM-barrel enzyme